MNIDENGNSWWNPTTWNWGKIGKGVGLIVTGVAAVVAGIATLPFGGAIAIVAGVTLVAGVGTAVFGLSDVGEGITEYNVIRDTIFAGNQEIYDIVERVFTYTAIIGTAICGVYGATHTSINSARSTPSSGKPHTASYNKQYKTMTYYGKDGKMKYSTHFFNKGHQWIHWHTEMPHSAPINNVVRFILEFIKKGF